MIDKCDNTKNKESFKFAFGNKIEVRFPRLIQKVPI